MSSFEITDNWRNSAGYKYFSSLDFEDGKKIVLTIKSLNRDTANNPSTKKSEPVISCYFEETEKPMVMNKTNLKMITILTGTPIAKKWAGKKVIIEKKKIRAFGRSDLPCLRVTGLHSKTDK